MAEIIYTLPEDPTPAAPAADAEGTYTHNPNHAEQAVANLIEFFRKPRNSEVMRIVGGQVQDAEDAAWQLANAFDVDSATGAVLDFLGAVVGERRDDREDADYRAAVRARILVNSSNGRLEELIQILTVMLPSLTVGDVHVTELYPAAVRFEVYNDFAEASPATVTNLLRKAKPAGVRLNLILVDTGETFIFRSPAGSDAVNGWGAKWARALL